MIFIDGIENSSMPSDGLGGVYPGVLQRTIQFAEPVGDQTYYYYIPTSYDPNEPMPIMALWHGSVVNQAAIPMVAQQTLDLWLPVAEANDFIVVAQAAIGSDDCAPCGWIPSTDSQILSFILDDLDNSYNIETTRKYLWGYSAGGNVMHAIALNNADEFAAYAVSGAGLGFAINTNNSPANALRQIPVYISVGQSDPFYPNPQLDIQEFTQAGWQLDQNLWLDPFIGGHEIANDLPSDAWDKICISTNLYLNER